VACGGETELALENSQLVQIDINQSLFDFGQAELGRLHTIAVGNIDEVNLAHNFLLDKHRANLSRILAQYNFNIDFSQGQKQRVYAGFPVKLGMGLLLNNALQANH
jgi:hypothetical protein